MHTKRYSRLNQKNNQDFKPNFERIIILYTCVESESVSHQEFIFQGKSTFLFTVHLEICFYI